MYVSVDFASVKVVIKESYYYYVPVLLIFLGSDPDPSGEGAPPPHTLPPSAPQSSHSTALDLPQLPCAVLN